MTDVSVRDRIVERRSEGVDPEDFLRDIGAVEVVDEDLAFTAEFRRVLEETVQSDEIGRITSEAVAGMADISPENVSEEDREYPAFKVIHEVRKWPSDGALRLDVATDRALHTWTDRWGSVPGRQRPRILKALRGFHETCPFCDGEMTFTESAVPSCCSQRSVIAFTCDQCDLRLLEFAIDGPNHAPQGPAVD